MSHAKLSAVYDRLRLGTAPEASRLLDCIRREDGVPGLSDAQLTPRQPLSDQQLVNHDNESIFEYEISQAGSYDRLGRAASLHLTPALEVGAMPQWTGAIDPNLTDESEMHSGLSLSPSEFKDVGLKDPERNEYPRRESQLHIGVSHRVLLWPAVYSYMRKSELAAAAGSDLQCIVKLSSRWLLWRETSKHRSKVPCNVGLPSSTSHTGSVFFPTLTIQRVYEYSSAYFNTFNALLPLLDQDLFMDGIVARLLRDGYRDDDPESVLALLVFALGQLAIEGVTGYPLWVNSNEFNGFRGGTIEKPPGLGLFNEARRRIGMINTQTCLENVQILLLQATYFESSARHLNFWSSTSAASLACTCLIRSGQIDWKSPYGNLVKRAYWICVLQERLFDLEFRMSSTSIESLENEVPLPHLRGMAQIEGSPGGSAPSTSRVFAMDEHDDSASSFVAMIAISRIIRKADVIIRGYEPSLGQAELLRQGSEGQTLTDGSTYLSHAQDYSGPPSILASELFHQLDCWRDALPQRLQWSDDDKIDFEEVEPLSTVLRASLLSPPRGLAPGRLDHNVDFAVAQLRTRFYQARFLICRPFIYKALHLPDLMTADDRIKCAFAIDAACLWPLSLVPPKHKKHLVPHLFSWTQNFLAMALVLRICQTSDYLSDICKESGISEGNIESAISAMVQWLDDIRQVDGIADWSMRVLGPAFSNRQ